MKHWQYLIARLNTTTPGKAPEWILLFAAGHGSLDGGLTFFVDQESFELVRAYVAKYGNEIVFDYEHQSVKGNEAPAAGWIKDLSWDPKRGILARVEWNERAANYIVSGEYKYFSPVFYVRKSDERVCGLHSVALTNKPKTKNLTPILAKLEAMEPEAKEETMDRDKLIAKLNLDPGASDADIMAALAKLGIETIPKETTIPEEVIAALGLQSTDSASTVVASIHAIKQTADNSVSRQEFNQLQAKLTERDAGDAVSLAIAKGKIAPSQKDWAIEYAKKDLAGFNTFVEKAPVVVPLGELPGKKKEADSVALDDATRQVAKQMGVSAEDIKTYGADQE